MSEKIIFATGNAGKLKEIREILKDLNREIVTMREAGFEGEIEERNHPFRENAEIKAKAVWEKTGGIVLAADFWTGDRLFKRRAGRLFSAVFRGHTV